MTQDEMNKLCSGLMPLWHEDAEGVVGIARRVAELPGPAAAYCAAYVQQELCEDGDTKASILFTDELARLSAAKTMNAAGELVAALEECAAWMQAELGDRLEVEPLANARAALAKARGQA